MAKYCVIVSSSISLRSNQSTISQVPPMKSHLHLRLCMWRNRIVIWANSWNHGTYNPWNPKSMLEGGVVQWMAMNKMLKMITCCMMFLWFLVFHSNIMFGIQHTNWNVKTGHVDEILHREAQSHPRKSQTWNHHHNTKQTKTPTLSCHLFARSCKIHAPPSKCIKMCCLAFSMFPANAPRVVHIRLQLIPNQTHDWQPRGFQICSMLLRFKQDLNGKLGRRAAPESQRNAITQWVFCPNSCFIKESLRSVWQCFQCCNSTTCRGRISCYL